MLKKFIFLLILLSLLLCSPALAGGLTSSVNKTAAQAGLNQNSDLFSIMSLIISGLLTLIGLLFVGLLLYGGYTWMTALGAEEKVKKAKNTITRSAIGLLIIILAYVIANYIFSILNQSQI
jgi:hypothetical protein